MSDNLKKEPNSNLNLIWATVLAIVAVFVFDFFFPAPESDLAPKVENAKIAVPATVPSSDKTLKSSLKDTGIPSPQPEAKILSVAEALANDARIKIENDEIKGSIRLKGARFDEIVLKKYRETDAKDSPLVELFAPAGTKNPKYAEFGFVSSDEVELPNSQTIWKANGNSLSVENPLVLTWTNKSGLKFTRTISLDEKYMFTIKDKVENLGSKAVSLNSYGLVARTGMPPEEDSLSYISFNGPIGVMENTLEEVNYNDLVEDGNKSFTSSEGGWVGITDKYWLSALIFDQQQKDVKADFIYSDVNNKKVFQSDFLLKSENLLPNSSIEVTNRLFVGVKEINLLDNYAKQYDIPRFDLAIDFGWYYFLTKPFLYILIFFNTFLGNMGLAILVFAFLLRLAVFPIANKSYVSMQKMKILQPKVKDLTERYKDDRQRLSQEMMNLYRKEGVNPASGCLPALIQIPIFFSLYKVLYIAIELRQAPFYGWIHDLSLPDPTSVLTLCGLINWPVPEFLDIGVWPLIMGITMYIQFKLNPQPTDKTQAMVFAWMPIIFTFMLAHFAAGLVIYWAWSNILAIIQQRIIIRRMDKALKNKQPLAKVE